MQSQDVETVRKRFTRQQIAEKLAAYEHAIQDCPSQRRIAEELGIPRSTLQHWLTRKDALDADPDIVAFFESPAGTAFLHRLVIGAHFVMTLVGPCGIRLVCQYLELTGLDRFVASSYCPQHTVSGQMEEAVVKFAQAEKARLANGMEPRQITVCEDETFHPEICLVAIEPVSNFILVEQYSESRKAVDWTTALRDATQGLAVEIIQSTSDEGKGILHHVKHDLGVHHSPDVFHVQHELIRGTSMALASKTSKAGKALEQASKDLRRQQSKQPFPPPHSDIPLEQAWEKHQEARASFEQAMTHQERVKAAIQGISTAYHPYDLATGTGRSAEALSSALQQHFSAIEDVASAAQLSERCLKKIKKAKTVITDMVATITFFLLAIQTKIEALSLLPDVERAVSDHLIPAIYLRLVSARTTCIERREQLLRTSEELLAPLRARHGPFAGLESEEIVVIERVAKECAQLFQRSSSCVEGRNGQLALRHHSLHRIRPRKLAALTAVHNFVVTRCDGTTAAERFFGGKPQDLFEYVLDTVELPGRPAQKRSQSKQTGYLLASV